MARGRAEVLGAGQITLDHRTRRAAKLRQARVHHHEPDVGEEREQQRRVRFAEVARARETRGQERTGRVGGGKPHPMLQRGGHQLAKGAIG